MRMVTMDPNKCVGCKSCEYACAYMQSKDFARGDSNIRVNFYPEEVICLPWTCVHCSEAWCMEVCPAGAISRDEETNAVIIDAGKCAGCKMCMLACPFGSIHFDPIAMVCQKCDLCDGDPACVKYCISGALQYVEVEEAFGFKRKMFDGKLKEAFKKN